MKYLVNWKISYKKRIVSAGEAFDIYLANGDRIFVGTGCGEPQHLLRELKSILPNYHDLEFVQGLSFGINPVAEQCFEGGCRLRSFFVSGKAREAIEEGRADYAPVYLSRVPDLFKKGLVPVDLAIIQVSPPDEHGFCSLGVSVDIVKAAIKSARTVIAQVNRHMPRVLGDTFVHFSEIDAFVEYDEPLVEMALPTQSAVAERIAGYVSQLIDDGSTIQVGIGKLLNSVLVKLKDKKDLGVHSEFLSDAHLNLVKAGVITGKKKSIHKGKMIASFCMGSNELYRFVENNPTVEFYPTEYVNNSSIIAQNYKMVALNSAIEVDLTGQVCADSLGHKIYSGIGGYVDFMMGASRSEGGRSIVVLPSTTPNGRKSRIVAHLSKGAGVVTPRSNIEFVVTEFGIAHLFGKTIRERALALINIAHPKFREELLDSAKRVRYVYEDQILPPIYEPLYPGQWETYQIFPPDNQKVFFRPIRPTDERALQEFFYSLPDEDIYYRFLSAMKVFPHRNIQAMVNIDYEHEMAIVGVIGDIGEEKIIALGRYILDQNTNMAEVDFAVRAEWQGKGIGTFLLHYLCEIAKSKGISGFCAYVLASNRRMLSIFYKVGYVVHSHLDGGVYEIYFRFDEPANQCITE